MPYKIIRRNQLWIELGFDDESTLHKLPTRFVTTCMGVQKALNEWIDSRCAFESDPDFDGFDWDQQLVELVGYRGGVVPNPNQEVIYPEEIIPLEHVERCSKGWRWNGQTKKEDYWLELQAQGDIWETMPSIPVFSRW
ncbi:hypothetical protein H2200_000532 [Cladophialophora chaetospira]|uniref:Uncharacterized protein n=1 Tax=Cladophialophora chaetospira TaxID=386627 RepID=A0AA38XNK9_9EURO|nr:hypothetical protein H2200_000532 [Cladophialophora chaetospira]